MVTEIGNPLDKYDVEVDSKPFQDPINQTPRIHEDEAFLKGQKC